MCAPFWTHIIGNHRGIDPKDSCSKGKCQFTHDIPYIVFRTYESESSLYLGSPIAMNCWRMPHAQGKDPTKLHQTYRGIQAYEHLKSLPSSPAVVLSSCAACQR